MRLWASPRFAEHTTPPGHPESPDRARVFTQLAGRVADDGGTVVAPRAATIAELARIHDADYLDAMARAAGRAVKLDNDTFTSPETYEIALLACGAAIDAARHAFRAAEPTLALVRPPGHHAEPDRGMGFCFFNNIAVAAAALRADGVSRVAIVDIDVHHGNGTQAAFYADPSVFYVSSHQFPFYPGTGAASEVGEGAGRGFTLNVPLPLGSVDADFQRAYDSTVLPALETFAPEVILVSAGFDAHERDPLAGMRMTTDGLVELVETLRKASLRLCGGRLALVTEGGYNLGALRECLEGTVEALR